MMTTGINTGVNNYIDRQVAAVGSEDYLQVMPAQMAEQLESLMSGSNEVREYKPEDNSTTSQIDHIANFNWWRYCQNWKCWWNRFG